MNMLDFILSERERERVKNESKMPNKVESSKVMKGKKEAEMASKKSGKMKEDMAVAKREVKKGKKY